MIFFKPSLLALCLLLVNTAFAETDYEHCLKGQANAPKGTIKTINCEGFRELDYTPILVDEIGKQIFICQNCPDKFCKEFSCTMSIDQETGKQKGDCKCIE